MTNKQLFFVPHPALRDVVNNIMIGHAVTNDPATNLSFQFPPLPEHSILFYPYDRPTVEDVITKQVRTLYACTITGPQTERSILSLGYNHLMIKIGFQPGALYRLLGQPMQEMLQKDYDGEAVFGSTVKYVVEALANSVDFNAMKNIAEEFMFSLLTKIKKPVSIDYIIPEIIKYGGTIKIDDLVKKACLSNRQFERTFKDRMGVSPKFYSRLVRFGKAWLLKENNRHMSWTQVAYECSYFDQMHLIRDFKIFTDTSPKEISNAFENQPFLVVKGLFY
ncbi:MAG: AraC family transcriptional regulator [Chitinophagaceae bacterium]